MLKDWPPPSHTNSSSPEACPSPTFFGTLQKLAPPPIFRSTPKVCPPHLGPLLCLWNTHVILHVLNVLFMFNQPRIEPSNDQFMCYFGSIRSKNYHQMINSSTVYVQYCEVIFAHFSKTKIKLNRSVGINSCGRSKHSDVHYFGHSYLQEEKSQAHGAWISFPPPFFQIFIIIRFSSFDNISRRHTSWIIRVFCVHSFSTDTV